MGTPDTKSLSSADARFSGEGASDYAGMSVAAAGDVDADGYADVVVGAEGHDDRLSSTGAACLVLGGAW